MGTLTGCIKKAGEYISPQTKREVLRAFNAQTKAGVKSKEAARSAVEQVLADIDRQLAAADIIASAKRKLERVDPAEMSTRVPYGKNAVTGDHMSRLLIADFAASRGAATWIKSVADRVAEYPNARPATSANTPEKVLERLVRHMADNLIWLHNQVPADIAARSRLWYDGASKIAGRMSTKYGLSRPQSSGILAVLSPQKDWFMNVSLAERVAQVMAERQSFRWSSEMEKTAARIFGKAQYAGIVDEIRGRSLEELDSDYARATWLRVYDEAHNSREFMIVAPEGDALAVATNKPKKPGVPGKPASVAWGSTPTIMKAVSVFRNGSIENIDEQLGRKHKVRNFYNNILVPNSPNGHVTIDTHAVAAALLRPLSGDSVEVKDNFSGSSNAEVGLSGAYALYEEAYRRAAEDLGLLPRELQSITWEAVRGMYLPRFKSQAVNVEAVDAVWNQFKKGRLSYEAARNQSLELADGIDEPSWYGSTPGVYEAEELADESGGVDGPGVPGRAAGALDGGAGSRAAGAVSEDLKASEKRTSVEDGADAIAALDEDTRDNMEPANAPGGWRAYLLYEARKMLPKPTAKLKRVTERNSFTLWQDFDHIINVDGKHYGVSEYEDPDATGDENVDKPVLAYSSLASDKDETRSTYAYTGDDLVEEIRKGGGLKASEKRNNVGQVINGVWTMPGQTKATEFTYRIQDRFVDVKDAIKAVEDAGRSVSDDENAYVKETLYHGRTAKRTKEFINEELKPLMESIRKAGLTIEEVEEYLQNRHAEERNDQVYSIGGMADGGSGIKTLDARRYLRGLAPAKRAELDAVARKVDAITRGTRQYLVGSGLEKQETIDAWEGAYKHYVPLNREEYEDIGGTGTGVGMSVRGAFVKRALGSDKKVTNILGNIARQREAAIIKAEKVRVTSSLFALLTKHPNPDLAVTVDPGMPNRDIAQTAQDLVRMGLDPADAMSVAKEPTTRVIDPKTGMIVERVNPALRNRDNVLAVRVDGEDRFIFFNETDERARRMSQALKSLDVPRLGEIMSTIAVGTRWLSAVNTQYNPIFGIYNYLRDLGAAPFNLTSTPLAGAQKEILGNSILALRGIYSDLRARRAGEQPTGAWSQLFEEFQTDGGQTGFRDLFVTPEDRQADIKMLFDPSSWAETKWGKFVTAGGTLKAPLDVVRKGGAPLMHWLSDYNESIENSIRLAAYKAGLDRGLPRQQAADIAKNLTVNFNRKGEIATQAGALYGFFNATVQGTDRLRQTLKGPAGKKILAGGLLLGVLQAMALAAAGYDDGDVPEWQKDRSLIVPNFLGDKTKFLAVPMPLGLHVLPSFARRTAEFAMRGFRDPAGWILGQLNLLADSFNPVGGGGDVLSSITPSVADPIVALGRNRDWTGRPIAKEDRSSLDPTPGHSRSKDTATPWSRALSEFLNWSTGGSEFTPGKMSPTPDQIDYLLGQIGGGVVREANKIAQVVESSVTGEDLPTYKIPLVGRMVGNTREAASERGRYYENLRRLNGHEREIKGRREAGRGAEIREYLAAHPEARLVQRANEVERDIQKATRRKREMVESGADPTAIRLQDEAITRRIKALNEAVRRARGG